MSVLFSMLTILHGDALGQLGSIPARSVQCCVTSPPYWGLRDYGNADQIGLELTYDEYIAKLVRVFREVRRALTDDGTLWLNLGDSYSAGPSAGFTPQNVAAKHGQENSRRAGGCALPAKNLIGIPWRVAFALQADGWYLRSDIIWAKPNPMPESVTDRPTRSHEYIFLLSKSAQYYYDAEAIKEPGVSGADGHGGAASRASRQKADAKCFPAERRNGMRHEKQRGHSRRHNGFNDRWDLMEHHEQCSGMRNKRDVWMVAPANYDDAHFATFPPDLIKPCVLAGTKAGDVVLDPFFGSGTTGLVAIENGRRCIGIELNPGYVAMAKVRCETTVGLAL